MINLKEIQMQVERKEIKRGILELSRLYEIKCHDIELNLRTDEIDAKIQFVIHDIYTQIDRLDFTQDIIKKG